MSKILSLLFASVAVSACASAAVAADLPSTKAPPPAPVVEPAYNWTGFYLGGQLGYGWGQESDNFSAVTGYPLGHFNVGGAVGGVHVGYDQQVNNFVFGILADVDLSGISGGKSANFLTMEGVGISQLSMRNSWQASIRARAGVAFDRVLVYATGGVAFADDRESYFVYDPSFPMAWAGAQTQTLVGWTVGGGALYAIDNHWRAGVEVRYADFGKANYNIPPSLSLSGVANSFSAGFSETLAQAVVSYRF